MNKNALYELVTDRPDANTYYNTSDLNRVETAVKGIAEYMNKIGYAVNVNGRTAEWNIEDFPTYEEMERFLNNVLNIRKQMNKNDVTLPLSMNLLTYIDANNIEKFLQIIDETLKAMGTSYRRCGITISGYNQYLDASDLNPFLDYFGTLTWHTNAPTIESGVLNLEYAAFNNGILEDI